MKKTLITAAGALLIAPFSAVLISSAPVHAIPSPPLCPVGQMPTGGSPLIGGGGGCKPNPNAPQNQQDPNAPQNPQIPAYKPCYSTGLDPQGNPCNYDPSH
jgi:hypothetical protein